MISSIRIVRIVRTRGSVSLDPNGIVTVGSVAETLTLEEIRDRLRLSEEDMPWLEKLAALEPTGAAGLPARDEAPAILERLRLTPEDAADVLAAWPSEAWPAELLWLLDRVPRYVAADMGGWDWLPPGPALDPALGEPARLFYVYAFLALVDEVRAWNAEHGIPDEVTWTTLADLGRNLAVDRRMNGTGWPIMAQWLTLHVRGGLYELGRLQYQRGPISPAIARAAGLSGDTWALGLHIPESGPLTPEAIDESLGLARDFFPRHFPDEEYRIATCGSWLLDPQLAEYLPADSNMVRFQRRFQLAPDLVDAGIEIFRFVFRRIDAELDELPQDSTLERAVVAHVRAGRVVARPQGLVRALGHADSGEERVRARQICRGWGLAEEGDQLEVATMEAEAEVRAAAGVLPFEGGPARVGDR